MKELTFSQKSLEISYKVRWLMLALVMLALQFYPVASEAWPNIYLFLSISAIYNITTKFLNLPELWKRTKNICYGETVMDTIFHLHKELIVHFGYSLLSSLCFSQLTIH